MAYPRRYAMGLETVQSSDALLMLARLRVPALLRLNPADSKA